MDIRQDRARRTAGAIILLSYLMIVLDISIVITGLPKIRDGFDFSPTGLSWVHNAYTLTFGGLLLLGARAGDILGRRRMFIIGLAIFTAASAAIGVAPFASWLITARAAQGVGAAILAPSTLALLTTYFPEGPERTRIIGYYGAVAGVGAGVGLALGGVLAEELSWRVGFFINLPIGAALMLGARRYLQETERRPARFDVIGAVTSTLGMSALVFGTVRAAAAGWDDAVTSGALITGVLSLALLVVNEKYAQQPIMPLGLFADRRRVGAYAARILFLGAMVGFWFFMSQFLQGVVGFSPSQAGAAFLPTALSQFAAAMAVPRLTRRSGNGAVLAGGVLTALIGLAWLSEVAAGAPAFSAVVFPMILLGVGQGFALSTLTVAGVAGVAAADAGAASGLVNTAHQLGGSLGLAVLIVVSAASGSATPAERIAAVFGAGSIMLALALAFILTLILRSGGHHSPGGPAAQQT
jgi:EmrB/QacA subfamily drug resistance transporter